MNQAPGKLLCLVRTIDDRGLKAELKRRGIGYEELADRLSAIGVSENGPNIRNKSDRGRFTAVFIIM